MRRAAGWLPAVLAAVVTAFAQTPAGWVPDASKAAFPARPASGVLFGKPFTAKVVEVQKSGSQTHSNGDDKSIALDVYFLSLRSAQSIFAPHIVSLSVMTPQGKPLDNRSYVVLPKKVEPGSLFGEYKPVEIVPGMDGSKVPWIQGIDIESNGENDEKVSSHFAENVFSLRLQFGKRKGDTLPGQIYLCVQDGDKRKHVVAGTFSATIH